MNRTPASLGYRNAKRIIIGANLATDLACVIGPAVLLVGVLSVTVLAR